MKKLLATLSIAILLPTSAYAVDDAIKSKIETRQAIFTIYGHYMGILGAMAKGEMPYDAELAGAAANNMLNNSKFNSSDLWTPGTDNSVPGLEDLTNAKPEGWSEYEKLGEISAKLDAALVDFAASAGNGLDSLRGSIGSVGKNCKACHEIAKAK
jgi:cytochrome c556